MISDMGFPFAFTFSSSFLDLFFFPCSDGVQLLSAA